VQDDVAADLLTSVLDGSLGLDALLTDRFVRDLHRRLYGDIWRWGGALRRQQTNLGIAPHQIVGELRASIETIAYRWRHTDDWAPHDLGIAVHAEIVRIHPFIEGNGRSTRLLADLVFVAAQDAEPIFLYDWRLERHRYVTLLREYDRHRDPTDLATFVGTQTLGG